MIAVYIASPYSKGDMALNVRKSLLAADELLRRGYLPFAPLLSHFWHLISPKTYRTWLEMDIEWLLRCDCVLRMPGESEGADKEVKIAEEKGIPIFHSIKSLDAFYKQEKTNE